MRTFVLAGVAALLAGFLALPGCAQGSSIGIGGASGQGGSASSSTGSGAAVCQSCAATKDCGPGEVCATISGHLFCAPDCSGGQACAAARTCTPETSTEGAQVKLCTPTAGCSRPATTTATGATTGSTGSGATCGGKAGPDVQSCCTACMKAGMPCQSNGCYGGYYCDASACKCGAPPAGCP